MNPCQPLQRSGGQSSPNTAGRCSSGYRSIGCVVGIADNRGDVRRYLVVN